MQPQHLSILGVGLLGGSLGLAVRSLANNCKISGYGNRPATLKRAEEIGAIDQGYDDPVRAVRDADLVVLCTPVGLLGELLNQIAPGLAEKSLVTDVGSTKRNVVKQAEQVIPSSAIFIGSHPMAGSEKRGVEFARADLFQNATCIVTPTEKTPTQPLKQLEEFWRWIGMKTVRLLPEEHDRCIADVSHLPHAVAAALIAIQDERSLTLAGKGFLDTTRIAGGDGGLWRDILVDNRDNLRDSIDRLKRQLDEILRLAEKADSEPLRQWLDNAAARREQLLQAKLREIHPD